MKFLKQCFEFMTKPWLLALIAIIILGLIIWFVGPIIAVGEYKPLASDIVRLSCIFVLFILWGLNNLRVKKATKQSENSLTENLLNDSNKSKSVEQSPDGKVLSSRLTDAIKLLNSSDIKGRNKLYSLPWYMIIGAPGSGKTTALKNSGLNFPLKSSMGDDPIHGEGGTRYCDWWFTDEAIMIDTAGRYTTQDNPKKVETSAWLGFLGMLKKTRPKRPLNGIIVTISINDILNKTATQKTLQTKAIKQRVQEINDQLSMDLPVYVVFTKVDMIAGFNSFFSDMDKDERSQAWGFSFPVSKGSKTNNVDSFEREYKLLMERLNTRVLARLDKEKNTKKRALSFEFPKQMYALEGLIEEFLSGIFSSNQFETSFSLRGIFFISSTQANMPSHWVTGVLPIDQFSHPVDSLKEPRTYFVNKLFKDFIFAEANLASLSLRARLRMSWAFYGLLLASVGVFLLTVSGWYNSKRLNVDYIERVESSVKQYREKTNGGLEKKVNWTIMAKGLDELKALPTGYEEGTRGSLLQGLGLYQGRKLGSEAKRSYTNALRVFFMRDLKVMMTDKIDGSFGNDELLYEALKYYLMLSNPDKMDKAAFSTWVNFLWNKEITSSNREQVIRHLGEHLQVALEEPGIIEASVDEDLVQSAREKLIETPLDYRIYRRLKNDYLYKNQKEFNVKDILGTRAASIFARRSGEPLDRGVSEFFTYKGFHTSFNAQSLLLAKRLADEQWIYGSSESLALDEAEIEAVRERVNQHYFSEYIYQWESYISDFETKPFSTINQGLTIARLLASSGKPLPTFLKAIRKHTALSELPQVSQAATNVASRVADRVASDTMDHLESISSDGVEVPKDVLPGKPVSDHFQSFNEYVDMESGLPLHELQVSLEGLHEYFQSLSFSDNQNQKAYEASLETGAVISVKQAVLEAPPIIQNWFVLLTNNSGGVVNTGTQSYLNDLWSTKVVSFYNQAIKGRYPIAPRSKLDIRTQDFEVFFGPGGLLDSFYQDHIQQFVDTSKRPWRWKDNTFKSRDALVLFERAQQIKEAYFDDAALSVNFKIKPNKLDAQALSVVLKAEGKVYSYSHGPPSSAQIQWPEGSSDRSELIFTLASGGTPVGVSTEGEWSLFRLMDKYSTTQVIPNSDSLRMHFKVRNLNVRYDLTPKSVHNPFTQKGLKQFTLKDKIVW